MKLSLCLANFTWPDSRQRKCPTAPSSIGPRVGSLAQLADEVGIDSLWAMDHLFQIGMNGPPEDDMLEVYSLLGFLAGQTRRIRLGALVTAVSYRDPGLLVKTVTTLDVLSGGRMWLGIGAAWNADESRGLGLFFPSTAERFERLEETLQIARQMWSDDVKPYDGKHYKLENPINNPNTVQRPHPPILIGGMGERKTLRLVAEYAQACNLFDIPDGGATIRKKLEILAEHCERAGTSYDAIEKTVASSVNPAEESTAQIVDRLAALKELGIEHVITSTPKATQNKDVEALAPVVEQLASP